MTIKSLLKDYNLEIDDVRWYLSEVLTQRLLFMGSNGEELIRFIWSGCLGDELHDMEEEYLRNLQNQWDEGTLDEHHLRDTLSEMELARRKRHGV